jgi:hypothetical protein
VKGRGVTATLGLLAACAFTACHFFSRSKNPCPVDLVAARQKHAPTVEEPVVAVKKVAWEQSFGGQAAAIPLIQARLVGWPQRLLADAAALPSTDREFAQRVARDTWRGLDALSNRENGLPMDNVHFADGAVAVPPARIGDYASGTNIGLRLVAIVGARDLQFISPAAAVEQIRRVLTTLRGLETYRGFLFNFYDTTSLERTSNFVSFIDASWLTAALMVVRSAVPELAGECSALIAAADFGFFYNPRTRLISHGVYANTGARSLYDYGMLYTEARLGSLVAIGKGDVPEAVWFEMVRIFPPECGGQQLTPEATRTTRVRGHEVLAGYYQWAGTPYVPSWGGSMFEALMPTLLLDEQRYAPRSLGANDAAHALLQQRFASEELSYPVWGLSPSAMPAGTGYGEYGAHILGVRGYAAGAVTPHAGALALAVSPAPALTNLRALAQRYAIYGEYGFYDAVDPLTGTVAYQYLALDQSMLFVALANYLTEHSIQTYFASDPIMQHVLPLIGEEEFFG